MQGHDNNRKNGTTKQQRNDQTTKHADVLKFVHTHTHGKKKWVKVINSGLVSQIRRRRVMRDKSGPPQKGQHLITENWSAKWHRKKKKTNDCGQKFNNFKKNTNFRKKGKSKISKQKTRENLRVQWSSLEVANLNFTPIWTLNLRLGRETQS